jgi:uncharacterized membrane protein
MRPLLVLVISLTAVVSPLMSQTYNFTVIDPPGLTYFGVNLFYGPGLAAINNAGQIVGFGSVDIGGTGGISTFLYSGGVFTNILVGLQTAPVLAINNKAQVTIGFPRDVGSQSVLWAGGVSSNISVPNSTQTVASGINDNGDIVGTFSDAGGVHGFVYSGGAYTTIDAPAALGATPGSTTLVGINNSGQIAGYFIVNAATGAMCACNRLVFLYGSGSFTVVPPVSMVNYASAINNNGQLIGLGIGPTAYLPFLFSGTAVTLIVTPNYPAGPAPENVTSLNNQGQVLITNFQGISYLYGNGTFTAVSPPGAASTNSFGINDGGQIVGTFITAAGQNHFFLATPSGNGPTINTSDTFDEVVAGMTVLNSYRFGTAAGNNVGSLQQLPTAFDPYNIAGTTVTAGQWQVYQPFNSGNFAFDSNSLNLTATIPQTGGLFPGGINSGQIWTQQTFQPGTTGYSTFAFRVRMKFPNGQGMWPAIWLYTKQPGLDDGSEIDDAGFYIMQWQNQFDWTSFDHGPGASTVFYSLLTNPWTWNPGIDFSADYHDYELIWTPSATYKYFDGQLILAQNFSWTAAGAPQLGINLAVGSSLPGLEGLVPSSLTEFPSVLSVQSISIWAE